MYLVFKYKHRFALWFIRISKYSLKLPFKYLYN